MDISIDLTPAQIGMFIAFSIMIVGLGMAVKRRAMRKKQKQVKSEVEEYEFKSNPETLAPEKVVKQQETEPEPDDEVKPKHDVDALLDSLKKDSEKE